MSYLDIHKALTQSIIDLNTGLPLAHENADFDSSKVSSFIDIATLMGDQDPITKTGLDIVQGIYQLTVYVKSGISTSLMLNAVDSIMGYYVQNLELTSNSQTVLINSTSSTGGRNEGGWYKNDISINFQSDILR